MSMLASEY